MNFFEAMEAVDKGKAVTNPECGGFYYKDNEGNLVYEFNGVEQATDISSKEQISEWELVERKFSFADAVLRMTGGNEMKCLNIDKVVCLEYSEFFYYHEGDKIPLSLNEKSVKSEWVDV